MVGKLPVGGEDATTPLLQYATPLGMPKIDKDGQKRYSSLESIPGALA
jgi:hypothetical protein